MATGGDPPSLDTHQETTMYSHYVVAPSYNSLVQYDPLAWPESKIIPDLAEGWTVSPDGTVLTFRFPKGVKWHDGTPFTSADAKFTIERHKDPPRGMKSPRQSLFEVVDRMEVPDTETLVIRLKHASASFIPTLAIGLTVVVPEHVVKAKGDMKRDVVGTGPFKFKGYSPGVGYESVKNPDYFRKGRPYLDGVKGYIVRDGSTRFAALRTARVHMINLVPGITGSEAELIDKTMPNLVVQRKPVTVESNIVFNVRKAPWDNPKVRQAVHAALNREAMIKVALEGAGVVGGLLYPEGPWALPQAELLKKPGYRKLTGDMDEAKKLLAEAGFPSGFKSSVAVRMDLAQVFRPAELFKTDMARLGIDLTIDAKETAGYWDALERGGYEVGVATRGSQLDDPDAIFGVNWVTKGGRNYMGYSDPKVDELFEKQSRILDKGERLKVVRQIEDIIMEANPALVIAWVIRIAAHSQDVKDYKQPPGVAANTMMQEIWLAK